MSEDINANDLSVKSTEDILPLNISARVIYQLGEQLISDEFVALAELIKNAYDADCTKVNIIVDTNIETEHGKGRIIIRDNGNGMTESIIRNAFLKISTNFKKIEKFSPHFNRRTLGEKGLGRLSIQRLGNFVSIVTSPRIDRIGNIINPEDINYYNKFNQYELLIDWVQFRDSNQDISSVLASFKSHYLSKPKNGTSLIIEGIRNLDFWNVDRKKKPELKVKYSVWLTHLFKTNQISLVLTCKLITNIFQMKK